MLVYAAFSATPWPRRTRLAAALSAAVAVEVGQLAWSPLGRSGLGALTIGSVFDPWDLAAYAAGLAAGVAWERVSLRRMPAAAPAPPAPTPARRTVAVVERPGGQALLMLGAVESSRLKKHEKTLIKILQSFRPVR
jgi:hypothetical protein